jgi:hypothetical protein
MLTSRPDFPPERRTGSHPHISGARARAVDLRGCPQIEDQTKWIVLAHRIERIWPPSKVTGDRLGSVVSLSEHHPAPA